MITRTKATKKMKTSQDVIAQYTGDVLTLRNEERLVRLGLQNVNKKIEEVMRRLEIQLENQNNGKASATSIRSKHKRSWLWMQRDLKPGEKLRYIQALPQTLPTKVNKIRRIADLKMKTCRRCKTNKIEDDAYILAAYALTTKT